MLYLLAGPTASGKSEYAIQFASRHHCEILSCDASAIYKGMDVGTAKPSQQQQAQVPHWGLDLVEPNEAFSIKDYVIYAQNCIQTILKNKHNVLVVGGSGFYLKSFLAPVVDAYGDSKSLKNQIDTWEQENGLHYLLRRLERLNPRGLPNALDIHNPIKVKKALLRCLLTGLSLQALYQNFQEATTPFDSIPKYSMLMVTPLEILRIRVQKRTQRMLSSGLIEEVRSLLDRNLLKPNTPAVSAIGYRETVYYLTKTQQTHSDFLQLKESIIHNTYKLIKKQQTWFRHQLHFDTYIYK